MNKSPDVDSIVDYYKVMIDKGVKVPLIERQLYDCYLLANLVYSMEPSDGKERMNYIDMIIKCNNLTYSMYQLVVVVHLLQNYKSFPIDIEKITYNLQVTD